MKDLQELTKVVIVLGTPIVDVFLIMLLLYDPFYAFFSDKKTVNIHTNSISLSYTISLILIGLLIVSVIPLVIRAYKKQKVFYPAPLLTLLVYSTLYILPLFSS